MPATRHQAQVPAVVQDYLKTVGLAGVDVHPAIVMEYRPSVDGWKRAGFRKRISVAWARKLRSQGITFVALELTPGGRVADFSVAEIIRGGIAR